jgi:putative ABC transport system permease protein
MALGADHTHIISEVMGSGLRGSLLGVPLGIVLTWALGRALSGMLFGVPAFHVPSIAAACLIVLAVTSGALFFPALAASKTDPATATRAD